MINLIFKSANGKICICVCQYFCICVFLVFPCVFCVFVFVFEAYLCICIIHLLLTPHQPAFAGKAYRRSQIQIQIQIQILIISAAPPFSLKQFAQFTQQSNAIATIAQNLSPDRSTFILRSHCSAGSHPALQSPGPSLPPPKQRLERFDDLYCCLNKAQICVMPSNFTIFLYLLLISLFEARQSAKSE